MNKKRSGFANKVESEKDDADPFGLKLYSDLTEKDILEALFELFKPLIEEGKNLRLTWEVLFRVYLLQGKYVLALQAIKNLEKVLNRDGSKLLVRKFLSNTAKQDTNANPAIIKVVEKGLQAAFPDFEKDGFIELYNQ